MRWQLEVRLPEGEGAVTAKRNPAATHGRIELFIVMAWYVVCGCRGLRSAPPTRYLQIQIPGRCYNTATLDSVRTQRPLQRATCNEPPTRGIPRWVSNTYLHASTTTDPYGSTPSSVGTALNLSPERLYYITSNI